VRESSRSPIYKIGIAPQTFPISSFPKHPFGQLVLRHTARTNSPTTRFGNLLPRRRQWEEERGAIEDEGLERTSASNSKDSSPGIVKLVKDKRMVATDDDRCRIVQSQKGDHGAIEDLIKDH